MPYFYTGQYDLSMEYAGHTEPGAYDQVTFRGDVVAVVPAWSWPVRVNLFLEASPHVTREILHIDGGQIAGH